MRSDLRWILDDEVGEDEAEAEVWDLRRAFISFYFFLLLKGVGEGREEEGGWGFFSVSSLPTGGDDKGGGQGESSHGRHTQRYADTPSLAACPEIQAPPPSPTLGPNFPTKLLISRSTQPHSHIDSPPRSPFDRPPPPPPTDRPSRLLSASSLSLCSPSPSPVQWRLG